MLPRPCPFNSTFKGRSSQLRDLIEFIGGTNFVRVRAAVLP
jgi:hypothetical protein